MPSPGGVNSWSAQFQPDQPGKILERNIIVSGFCLLTLCLFLLTFFRISFWISAVPDPDVTQRSRFFPIEGEDEDCGNQISRSSSYVQWA